MRFLPLLCLIASAAFAQTYVRPSKGRSFEPFATTPSVVSDCGSQTAPWGDGEPFPVWSYWPNLGAVTQPINACSAVYDWTAFDGMQVIFFSSNAADGITFIEPGQTTQCHDFFARRDVANVGNYVRFRLYQTSYTTTDPTYSGLVYLEVQEAPTPSGPFNPVAREDNGAGFYGNPIAGNCSIRLSVTPVPFQQKTAVAVKPAEGTYSFTTKPTVECGDDFYQANGTFARIAMTGAQVKVMDSQASAPLYSSGYARICNETAFNEYAPVVCGVSNPFFVLPDGGVQIQSTGYTISSGECVDNALYSESIYCTGNPGTTLTKRTCTYGQYSQQL